MAGTKLDGAGTAKMTTINDALLILQRMHGLVELMAIQVKAQKPILPLVLNLKRTATPMIGMLKGQFGLLSDQTAAMLLVATRGNNDQSRVRGLREGIAQLRQALEIAANKVKEQHTVTVGESADDSPI